MSSQDLTQFARATPPTLAALKARAELRSESQLTRTQRSTLVALLDVLVPQGESSIDLASPIDAMLRGPGDGWRFDKMPADRVAVPRGLDALDATCRIRFGHPFVDASIEQRQSLVADLIDGRVSWPDLDATCWFVELHTAAVEAFVSHPRTLLAIGASAPLFPPAWRDVGLNATQAWEPRTP